MKERSSMPSRLGSALAARPVLGATSYTSYMRSGFRVSRLLTVLTFAFLQSPLDAQDAHAQAPAELTEDINATTEVAEVAVQGFMAGSSDLFFVTTTEQTGSELWRTNGTASGTMMVKDIAPGLDSSDPANLSSGLGTHTWANVNGKLFFSATDGSYASEGQHGFELWQTDGTPGGTFVIDANSATIVNQGVAIAVGSSPRYLTDINGTLFFAGQWDVNSAALWRSDGTATGTVRRTSSRRSSRTAAACCSSSATT